MSSKRGVLYLIPTTIGENEPLEVLPLSVKTTLENLKHFIVENEKTARRFIKRITPKKSQADLILYKLDKYAKELEIFHYLDCCEEGFSVGLLSESGVPSIADPGAEIVALAHQKDIRVIPLVGPSSILLAMMASGLNGQNFAFNGYLPIDANELDDTIKELEKESKQKNQSQIFIETPYRNERMFKALIKILKPKSKLCIATHITLPDEYIKTKTVKDWENQEIDFHKKPTIFIFHASE